eukprot:GFUD01059675.1.p1 GENE.GFUD01059675.1~~GFUD01059675.1.p1  ORF type:complete len:381 (+),score=98.56 GFUD01059675.1:41-1183(+)
MSGQTQNPISKVLLEGLYDQECPLSRLRGCPHLLRVIWEDIREYWRGMIELPCEVQAENKYWCNVEVDHSAQSSFYLTPISSVSWDSDTLYSFPTPSDININMMPFIVGKTFESSKLPEYVKPYWSLIKACINPELNRASHHLWDRRSNPSDLGRVYYLTIQESFVGAGSSQRRPGLHVDSPGEVKMKNEDCQGGKEGKGSSQPYRGHHWGEGCAHYIGECNKPEYGEEKPSFVLQGGIYLASSMSSSCKAWNCKVAPKGVGRLGDIEHLRGALPGPGQELQAGQLYWITDRTPHESLALSEGSYRQFFRLVTSQVSLWYKNHSTHNPLGVEPDPSITRVVVGDKFGDDGVEVVEPDPSALERRMEELERLRQNSDSDTE